MCTAFTFIFKDIGQVIRLQCQMHYLLIIEISLKFQNKKAMKGDDKYAYVGGSSPE